MRLRASHELRFQNNAYMHSNWKRVETKQETKSFPPLEGQTFRGKTMIGGNEADQGAGNQEAVFRFPRFFQQWEPGLPLLSGLCQELSV